MNKVIELEMFPNQPLRARYTNDKDLLLTINNAIRNNMNHLITALVNDEIENLVLIHTPCGNATEIGCIVELNETDAVILDDSIAIICKYDIESKEIDGISPEELTYIKQNLKLISPKGKINQLGL